MSSDFVLITSAIAEQISKIREFVDNLKVFYMPNTGSIIICSVYNHNFGFFLIDIKTYSRLVRLDCLY